MKTYPHPGPLPSDGRGKACDAGGFNAGSRDSKHYLIFRTGIRTVASMEGKMVGEIFRELWLNSCGRAKDAPNQFLTNQPQNAYEYHEKHVPA
jgi:hypothetical protein